ncbi:OV-16 antigen-like [Oppia nitens]|uniref:OV-16 antigen-like n=1 Tax=Oppia nitens TaxID=1686743 RepID=UPI0023DC52D5|nr:OV-16 antigen-like [Oppia nitens]
MLIHYSITIVLVVSLIERIESNRRSVSWRAPGGFGRRLSNNNNDSSIEAVVIGNGIVPDVVDSVPNQLIKISYPSGVGVDLGNELTPFSVRNQPSIEWSIEPEAYYTLVMTDPDVPSRKDPTNAEVKHWLVINIPGNQVSKGESLAAYRGSGPPLGSGLHRYVFLVYKQPTLIINHSEPVIPTPAREGRLGFKVREFARKYHLGEPVAINFYLAQYDDYVGWMRAQSALTQKPSDIETTIVTTTVPTTTPLPPVKSQRSGGIRFGTKRRNAALKTWTPKMPDKPKFPQMVCINYDRYLEIQNELNN